MKTIRYYLKKFRLHSTTDYKAIVTDYKVVDLDMFVDEMMKRGSSLTRPDLYACTNLMFRVAADIVADGNHLNLPLLNIHPSISGLFNHHTDSFDNSRHKVRASITAGTLLTATLNEARTEKVDPPLNTPRLLVFEDIATNQKDTVITPGGIGKIMGRKLDFNIDNPEEGLFLKTADNDEHRISRFAEILPGKLVFSIPANLPPGNTTIIFRRFLKNAPATIVEVAYDHPLTV